MTDAKMAEAKRLKAKALARWEGEGGSLGTSAATDQALDEAELRILSRLGAAVLIVWNKLPDDLQRAIFSHASTLHAPTHSFQIKVEIDRFLHDNKDN